MLDERAAMYDVILACGVVIDRPHTVNVAHFVHGTWIDSPHHPAQRLSGPKAWYYRLYSALNARWEQKVWEQAQTIVAVSENVARDVVSLGIPAPQVRVIPNGVSLSEFQPGRAVREQFGLPGNPPMALFTGDLQSPIKNVDTLLNALREVPTLHLALAGAIDQSPYPDLARKLGVADRTHFLGYQTAIPDLMRSVDFLVLPSHQDAFGLVVTEAMAAGLPVIVSTRVGASCLVDSSTGIVFGPPDDGPALQAACRRLAGSPPLRRRMGRAARARAETCSWERMGNRYLDLFRHLTARRSATPTSPFPSPV
jgi:glycosyltransferase involved in cell wall biosynthesis